MENQFVGTRILGLLVKEPVHNLTATVSAKQSLPAKTSKFRLQITHFSSTYLDMFPRIV